MNDLNDTKFKKKRNIELKTCKTFKNCGENINKAQLLLFNKGNNNKQQLLKPKQRMSTKNCLSSTKRGSLLQNSKRFKKQKEYLDKEFLFKNENEVSSPLKRKKTYFRSHNSNNKLLYLPKQNNIFELEEENNKEYNDHNKEKENKDNYNNVFNQFKKNNNAYNNYMAGNDNKKRKKFNTTRRFRLGNHDKIKKSNKNTNLSPEIIIDTDNEVETNILCLLDKSFRYKNRFSATNTKKCKNYGTLGIVNDKVLRNFKSSLESKKIKSNANDIGKTSNSNSISIIRNTEVNHCTINNNEDDDDFIFNLESYKHRFRNISAQKVVSFEYNDNDNEENGNDDNKNCNSNQNNKNKNKNKKKFIIYNNINYYKTTQRNENNLENGKDGNDGNDNDKNDEVIYNKKNSFNNNSSTKNCCGSLFNCCFLLE